MDEAVLMNKVETYVLTKKAMDKAEEDLEKLRPELEAEAKSQGGGYGKNIVMVGSSADLQVVYKEKITIVPNDDFVKKFNSGFYSYIKKSVKLNIADADAEKAQKILQEAGIHSEVTTDYKVDTKKKVASKDMDSDLQKASSVEEVPVFNVINSND